MPDLDAPSAPDALDALDALVTPEHIDAARARIAPYVRHTPLEPSPALSDELGAPVYLKLESMQVTGSFKPRIAFNKLLTLSAEEKRRGVIASTAGGHGIGVSYAARALGIPARIYLPRSAEPRKIAAIERNGAELTYFESIPEARNAARAEAERRGWTFVSAYNDPVIIAGGGTVGLEIVEDGPEVGRLVVGIGGGGLLAGSAIAIRRRNPGLRVLGIQPENSAVVIPWLEAGRPVPVDVRPSIADGLGANIEEDSLTFPLAQRHVDQTALVSEDEIRAAMDWLLAEHQLVVEPSGAAPVAALRKVGKGFAGGGAIAVVVTGRNVNRERYFELLGVERRAAG